MWGHVGPPLKTDIISSSLKSNFSKRRISFPTGIFVMSCMYSPIVDFATPIRSPRAALVGILAIPFLYFINSRAWSFIWSVGDDLNRGISISPFFSLWTGFLYGFLNSVLNCHFLYHSQINFNQLLIFGNHINFGEFVTFRLTNTLICHSPPHIG